MTEEGGRPPAAFEELGRSPATSGGLRTAPTEADGWLGRLEAVPLSNPFPRRDTVLGAGIPRGHSLKSQHLANTNSQSIPLATTCW